MESDTITNSDYAIVSASIATRIIKKSRTAACDKRLKGKKQVFNLDKATEENQETTKQSQIIYSRRSQSAKKEKRKTT